MLLPNIFMQAFGDVNSLSVLSCELSEIKIICSVSDPKDVKDFFKTEFDSKWEKLSRKYLGENDEGDISPVSVYVSDNVVRVRVEGMTLRDKWGADQEYSSKPLENALKSAKKNYEDIEFSGFVITEFSSNNYGEIYAEEILPDGKLSRKASKTIYPQIGEVLRTALAETDEGISPEQWELYGSNADGIWDYIESESEYEDFEELLKCFFCYSDYLEDEHFDRLIEIVEDFDDELAEKYARKNKKRIKDKIAKA